MISLQSDMIIYFIFRWHWDLRRMGTPDSLLVRQFLILFVSIRYFTFALFLFSLFLCKIFWNLSFSLLSTLWQNASSGPSTGIAQRARHRDELQGDEGNWLIDIDYYLSQQVNTSWNLRKFITLVAAFYLFIYICQIHPVVSRLCASIQGTSPARLAECLGLDSSKVQLGLKFCL